MLIRKKIFCLSATILLLVVSATRAADTVTIDGFAAYTDTVLARLNQGELKAQGVQALNVPGGVVEKAVATVPGLVVLRRDQQNQLGALNEDQERESLLQWINELKATGKFQYVEPDYRLEAYRAPTDAAFLDGRLWGLNNFGQSGGVTGADIAATNAWELTIGDPNVIVGVVDSGVRYTHQDLAAQMWINPTEIAANGLDDDNDGYVDNVYGIDPLNNDGDPMDDNDHGTHCAGTIGAAANDGNPHVGVAWQVRIMALKFLGEDGFGPTSAAIDCINFAVARGVKVLNNSWGGGPYQQALFDSILAARNSGVLFVAAAGNERNDNDRFPAYPASYQIDNIISVAALDRQDRIADFSNFGRTSVHLGAPGVEIFSSVSTADNAYEFFQGTSMAAPHVSGAAALVAAYSPGTTYTDIRSRILDSVTPIASLANNTITGGRLDAWGALTRGVDGVMEFSITPSPDSFITIGTNIPILISVTDGVAVTNATVTASGGGTNLVFLDNGTAPDEVDDDGVYSALFFVPNTPGPITLTLNITAPGKTNLTQTVTYNAVNRPSNDLFGRPVKVPVAGRSYEQSTRFATIEDQEPLHAGEPEVSGSVWYTWSLPSNSSVIVDTAGSTFDTVVGVYTGSSLGSLVEVVSTNDIGGKQQAWVKFNALAGVSYKIAIAGAGTNEVGQLRVRFEPNGEPDTIPPIVEITNPISGIVVTEDRLVISGFSFDPMPNSSGVREVQVKVNEGLPTTAFGTTNWASTNLLSPGINTIRVVAFDFAENQSLEDRITVTFRSEQYPNDLFQRANELTGNSGVRMHDSAGAIKEYLEPMHAGQTGGKSLWYRFIAPENGILFLSTEGSDFDTLLAAYTGNRVTNLTEVASNDDVNGGTTSELTFAVRAGQTYSVAVDGYDAASGKVVLNYTFAQSPTFDLTATSTEGGTVSPSGTTALPVNSTVSLVATPNQYFQFKQFETSDGTVVSTQNPYTIKITSSIHLVARFEPRQFTDNFETGGLGTLPYVVNGWTVSGGEVGTGSFAARSTATRDQNRITNSLVLVTNLLQGLGSFEFRVSSETNSDRLEFYVDNTLRGSWSGEVPWSTFEFEIPRSGLVPLEWRYVKDPALAVGLDAAFIDNLSVPIGLVPTTAPEVRISVAGETLQITLVGMAQRSYIIEASENLESWTTITTVTPDLTGQVNFTDSGSQSQRFYRARSL